MRDAEEREGDELTERMNGDEVGSVPRPAGAESAAAALRRLPCATMAHRRHPPGNSGRGVLGRLGGASWARALGGINAIAACG